MTDTLTIAENERRFIAQELHDHIAQTLLQMNMQVSICKKFLEMGYQDEVQNELGSLEQQIHKASQQLRDLMSDLRPPLTEDGLFDSALHKLIKTHDQRGGPPINLNKPEETPISGAKKLAVVRIIQEILQNIRKHAQATQVNLTVKSSPTSIEVTVIDNGVGFDDALVPNPLAEKGGAGMINMHIRSAAVGGKLDVKSQVEKGTMVKISVPL